MQCTQPQIKNHENQLQETGIKATDLQPALKALEASALLREWKYVNYRCIQGYIFSYDLVLHGTNQLNLYAVQHGIGNLSNLKHEIRTFIAVLFVS